MVERRERTNGAEGDCGSRGYVRPACWRAGLSLRGGGVLGAVQSSLRARCRRVRVGEREALTSWLAEVVGAFSGTPMLARASRERESAGLVFGVWSLEQRGGLCRFCSYRKAFRGEGGSSSNGKRYVIGWW